MWWHNYRIKREHSGQACGNAETTGDTCPEEGGLAASMFYTNQLLFYFFKKVNIYLWISV